MIAVNEVLLWRVGRNLLKLVLVPATVFVSTVAGATYMPPSNWIETDTQTMGQQTEGLKKSYIRSKTKIQDSTVQYDIIEGYYVAGDGNVYVNIVKDGTLIGTYYYPGGEADLPPQNEENWEDRWLPDGTEYGDADDLLAWWDDYLDWSDGGYEGDYRFWSPEPSSLLLSGFAAVGLFYFLWKRVRR